MLEIVYKKVSELKPYDKNPRKNDSAVEYVVNSIKDFGFKIPCVVDKNNVIICGHTRHKAAKILNMETIPCVVADDLNEQQIKAFRIADNRVSEFANWDFDMLEEELASIVGIDMKDFDFEVNIDDIMPEDDYEQETETQEVSDEEFVDKYIEKYGEENVKVNYDDNGKVESVEIPTARMDTIKLYNLHLIDNYKNENGMFENDLSKLSGFMQFPKIRKTDFVPTELGGFDRLGSHKTKNLGIHFYLDDYAFERIWTKPEAYVSDLKRFDCVISPDFSLYYTMPMAMKIWNLYRNRVIANYFQSQGITVIPTVSCCVQPEVLKFAFDGIEPGGTIAVSSMSTKKDKKLHDAWKNGVTVMLEKLKPSTLIVYGGKVDDYDFGKTNVVYFDNTTFNYRKE